MQWWRICLPIQEMLVQSLGWKIPWSRKCQPTPVFLPGKFHGQKSLGGYSPWVTKSWTWLGTSTHTFWVSQVVLVVKNPSANKGDAWVAVLIPWSGRSPGVGNGNLLQYSCLENSMDRGAWRATVHGTAENETWLSDWAYFSKINH